MARAAALPRLAEAVALAPAACDALRRDDRRIVIVGASGWIGRALLAGLFDALGEEAARARIACFGSSEREVRFGDHGIVQQPLDSLADLETKPTILFHLAFLTKDKVGGMSEEAYVTANRSLSGKVLDALGSIGADRIFVASSGAAAFADDPDAAHDLRLYGSLKRDDEQAFGAWAESAPGRRSLVIRIYALSGPFINKHETYALASFVIDALADRPIEVRAPIRVERSFVPVREVTSLALAELMSEGPPSLLIDSGGTAMELADVAEAVANRLGGSVERAAIGEGRPNIYTSDPSAYDALLARHSITSTPMGEQAAQTAVTLMRQIA